MTASPEQLLALLEAPHWKTPGSISRKTEGPTARRTEGQAAVNLTVLDHIADGRQTLDRAAKLAAEGTPLAKREAQALRTAQVMKSETLMGDTAAVRQHRCPACGSFSLLPKRDRAFCVNRHCAPAGIQRRWAFRDLAFAGPGTPKRIVRSQGPARDLVDKLTAVAFFAPTGHGMSVSTIARLIGMYALPTVKHPTTGAVHVSLSDLMTAHAVHTAGKQAQPCETDPDRPACAGLGDLFFGETQGSNPSREAVAKQLCDACPLKAACLDSALEGGDRTQQGFRGGLNAADRRQLVKGRRPSNKTKTHCPAGHPYAGDNLHVNAAGERSCVTCLRAQRNKSQAKSRRRTARAR